MGSLTRASIADIDFVFATSLFTHLLPEDAEHYVSEMARVLRPGGRCLCTFLLINPDVERRAREGRCLLDFRFARDGYRVVDEEMPENAVAYHEVNVRRMYAAQGLVVHEPVHHGAWSGHEAPATFQDIVIASKQSG